MVGFSGENLGRDPKNIENRRPTAMHRVRAMRGTRRF